MPDFQNFEMTYWVWFAAAAVLAIMEIIAPGIFMIWLAMAAAATGAVTLALGFGWELQLAVFAVLAVVAVFAGRNFLKRNPRSEEHTSELQSLMRISSAVLCLTQ